MKKNETKVRKTKLSGKELLENLYRLPESYCFEGIKDLYGEFGCEPITCILPAEAISRLLESYDKERFEYYGKSGKYPFGSDEDPYAIYTNSMLGYLSRISLENGFDID